MFTGSEVKFVNKSFIFFYPNITSQRTNLLEMNLIMGSPMAYKLYKYTQSPKLLIHKKKHIGTR